MTDEQPWLSLTEAAAVSGVAREAIRARIRRGLVTSHKGNRGELLVQMPAGLVADHGRAGDTAEAGLVADLLAEVAELREGLARATAAADTAKAVAEARVEAARDAAAARVSAARVEVAALRELADRLTAELAEARRSWWRRLLGAVVLLQVLVPNAFAQEVGHSLELNPELCRNTRETATYIEKYVEPKAQNEQQAGDIANLKRSLQRVIIPSCQMYVFNEENKVYQIEVLKNMMDSALNVIPIAPPEYKMAIFGCSSDYELCKIYYKNTESSIDYYLNITLGCLLLYALCFTEQIVSIMK